MANEGIRIVLVNEHEPVIRLCMQRLVEKCSRLMPPKDDYEMPNGSSAAQLSYPIRTSKKSSLLPTTNVVPANMQTVDLAEIGKVLPYTTPLALRGSTSLPVSCYPLRVRLLWSPERLRIHTTTRHSSRRGSIYNLPESTTVVRGLGSHRAKSDDVSMSLDVQVFQWEYKHDRRTKLAPPHSLTGSECRDRHGNASPQVPAAMFSDGWIRLWT